MCSPPPAPQYLHLLQTPTSQKTPRNPWRRAKASPQSLAGGWAKRPRL